MIRSFLKFIRRHTNEPDISENWTQLLENSQVSLSEMLDLNVRLSLMLNSMKYGYPENEEKTEES